MSHPEPLSNNWSDTLFSFDIRKPACKNFPGSGQYTQRQEITGMEAKRFIYYEEDGMWTGWLEDYPDYRTQAETLDELRENLKDIHKELTNGNIPCVRRVGELVFA